jgi:hypothetical protein
VSITEQINIIFCIYTMEFYPAKKKNRIVSLAGEWVELEIVLSDTARPERQIISLKHRTYILRKNRESRKGPVWAKESDQQDRERGWERVTGGEHDQVH